MPLETWGDAIIYSLQQVSAQVVGFLPKLIGALIIFIIGWIVAIFLGKMVEQMVRVLRVDHFLSKLDFERAMQRAGWKLDSGAFVGGLVKWFLLVVFLLAATNALGLEQVSNFLADVLRYLPNVVVAALILIIAALVAETMEKVVRGSAAMAGHRGAIVGVTARWAVWIFAIMAVLLQLGIAPELVQTLIAGLVYGAALAFALAFGLGGRDAASQFIERVRSEIKR